MRMMIRGMAALMYWRWLNRFVHLIARAATAFGVFQQDGVLPRVGEHL